MNHLKRKILLSSISTALRQPKFKTSIFFNLSKRLYSASAKNGGELNDGRPMFENLDYKSDVLKEESPEATKQEGETVYMYDSPSISQFKALKGSMASILTRGLLLWNFVMFLFEVIFFPYDLKDILTFNFALH